MSGANTMRMSHSLCCLVATVFLVACGPSGPASLTFESITPTQPEIGQITTVKFVAVDYNGQALPGQTVNFSALSPLTDGGVAGIVLNPTSSLTSKGDGSAETTVVANSRVSSVIVVATAGGLTAMSPPITFAGAIPSARNFTFQCGELDSTASGGIHGIRVYDETKFLIEGVKINCSAHVADRDGNGLVGVEVSFMAEAGTITPSQTTVTDEDGNATVLFKSTYPLPIDVTPGVFKQTPWMANDPTHIGDSSHPIDYLAPLWMHPYEWVANPLDPNNPAASYNSMFVAPFDNRAEPQRPDPVTPSLILNPRDQLITLIAVTTGEEEFTDNDGSGKFDPANDTFIDSTEPFVDANDNGTWDPGELFIDTNGNGKWDGKNGQFDPSTLIWAKERLLWTGMGGTEDVSSATSAQPTVVGINNTGLVVPRCASAGPVTIFLTDPWYNTMTQDAISDGCTLGQSSQVGSGGTFISAVIGQPTTFDPEITLTYPPVALISFQVVDNTCTIDAGIPYPLPFTVPVSCNFTSAPISGDVLTYTLPAVSGVIQ
jgi:hypothetical protein